MSPTDRPIHFLSDFGYVDESAGVCRAVIARTAPAARLIDLTHGIAGGDVRRGALALESSVRYAADGVFLAVVDPGGGTSRRALALKAGQSFLVGPDNGLLMLAAEVLGGVSEAVDISETALRMVPTSATFHGRDIFSPVAAALSAGANLSEIGESVDPADLVPLDLPKPEVATGRLVAHVLYADGFGNLVLDAAGNDLAQAGLAEAGDLKIAAGEQELAAVRGHIFADAGNGLVLYEDSSGRLGLALAGASAAERLGTALEITVTA